MNNRSFHHAQGHNKPITALGVNADGSTVYTGDYSGRVVAWDLVSGEGTEYTGKGHTNQVWGEARSVDACYI